MVHYVLSIENSVTHTVITVCISILSDVVFTGVQDVAYCCSRSRAEHWYLHSQMIFVKADNESHGSCIGHLVVQISSMPEKIKASKFKLH